MEYVALFVWLVVCLLLGGLMHMILQTPYDYKLVRLLAAPGIVVRKFAMTVTSLLTGATVTEVNIYNSSERDIGFEADGMASVSKVLVPLAPLFACAVMLQAINALIGKPIGLDYPPPPVSSLDAGGMRGFLIDLWHLLSGLIVQVLAADWKSLNPYVLFAFIFSLSLGACVPPEKLREGILGATFVAVGLAVICALFGVRSGVGLGPLTALSASPAQLWVMAMREFFMDMAGMAFIMMLCGLMAAIVVGIIVRIFELVSKVPGRTQQPGRRSKRGRKKMAA